jgi:hypothetical protein
MVAGLAAMGIVFVLWNIPQLDFILYPFRLFVTFVHEAGHGLAAILTGGRFEGFEVYSSGAGQALTVGGSRAVILPAGYLGAALFGAVLFYLVNSAPFPRTLAGGWDVDDCRRCICASGIGPVYRRAGRAELAVSQPAEHSVEYVISNLLAVLTGLNAVLDLVFGAE